MILPSGRALRLGVLLAAGSLLGVAWSPAGWACVGLLGLLAAAVLAEGLLLPRQVPTLTRRPPRQLSLDEPEEASTLCENAQRMALEIRLLETWPEGLVAEAIGPETLLLPPGGSAQFQVRLRSPRRGELRWGPPLVRWGRAGGLAVRQDLGQGETVLRVLPNVARLKRYEILKQARALSALGIHRTRQSGLGVEFDHLKPYGADDDLRRIHWKATARRGLPVSQVVRMERGQCVLLAVDLSHWMGVAAGELTRLDYAVDAALFLAHVAARSGDRVGLVLFAEEVLDFLPPSSRPGQVRNMLETLYAVRPRPVHPSYRNLARHLLTRRLPRSLVAVLSEPPDDESVRELNASLGVLKPRHLPLHVGLKDPGLQGKMDAEPAGLEQLCLRLAAREAAQERAQRLQSQALRGLGTLDVLPKDLSVSLVNRYLALKSSGTL